MTTIEFKNGFKKGELLGKMLVLVANKHAGQFDKSGAPYALHVLKVMHYLKSDDEELNCIALGHDLVEDTDTTYAELYDLGMTERIVHGIKCLTKVPGETYDEYRSKVKSNPDSVKVKKRDLRHNSDIRRLKGITEKDLARNERYHRFYAELTMMDPS